MTDLSRRIAALSPDKQKLLQALLRKEGGDATRLPILPRPSETNPIPLSFGQEQLWFLYQLDPGNPVYNEFRTFRLHGAVNVAVLERTLNEIVRRHEVLRTTFIALEGRPVQVIAPALSLTVPVVDLQALPDSEREAHAERLIIKEVRRPFDLARGPLIRAAVLRLGEEQHVLVLTLHHNICDGWSVGVLTHEVMAVYPAFCQTSGQVSRQVSHIEDSSPLQPLPIQYADFAIWQRQWLQAEVLETHLSYWQEQLRDSPPLLELPTDHPRPAVMSFRGAKRTLHFSRILVEALKELSRQEAVTLFMVLLAAFKTLLQRYTGQDDLIVGSPVSGRNRSELENLIGFFVNTLVLRTDLSGDPSFRELLSRVRQVTLGAYAHQALPFETLVASLRPERNRSYTPVFQVLFVFEPPFPAVDLMGLSVTPMDIDSGVAKTDLNIGVWESSEGLSGFIEYSVDLFEAATIERLVAHWQTLLEGIVSDPEQQLSALPILTAAERHQVLATWNETQTHYPDCPQTICLQQLFELQVKRTPNAVAVVFEETQYTYHELNCRANQLAHYLRDLPEFGAGPEVLVGVYMERCLELVVGLLAILKAGGAYVPLDPSYPQERLAYMLANARISVLVTQERLVHRLPEHQAQLVCLDTDKTVLAGYPAQNPVSTARADNLAYVIYTSGSTGTPKGVMNTHRGICNRLVWMQETYQLTETDRVLQKTPISFDVSVWEFFWPLLAGARLVLARPEGQRDSAYLVNLIAEQHITTLHFVPAMLQLFLETPGLEQCHCLRRVICSGEVLPVELRQRFFERLSAELYNLYGPTEAAIDVTAWKCRADDQHASVPIGRPIANTQIYILDGCDPQK